MGNVNVFLCAFLLIFTATLVFIALYTYKFKLIAGKNMFTLICICSAIYTFGYAMELYFGSLERIIFWTYVEYIGLPFITAFWLVFALKYCERSHILTPRMYVFIFIIPIITFILRYTNDFHHLFYTKLSLYNNGFFNVLNIQRGPWYYVFFVYSNIVELVSGFLYWQLLSKTNAKMRSQALIMFFASIFPWISIWVITIFKSPYGIDLGPFALTISAILFLIGFYKYDFLSLKPIARDKVFEWSNDGIIILDYNYSIIDFNISASKIITALNSTSIGQNVNEHLKDYTELLNALQHSVEQQFKVNGCYYSVKLSKITDKNSNIIGYLVFIHDITDHIRTMKKLNCIANTDELTGVFNRKHFTELSEVELSRAKRYNHPLSFIMIDVDLFKTINDKYGHLAGDEVLKNISTICKNSIRSSDILGRFGGEEFMILLPETRVEEAIILASRICKNIELSEVIYYDDKINFTASLGVTGTASVENENLNAFFKFADMALYTAKNDGRNCVRNNVLR